MNDNDALIEKMIEELDPTLDFRVNHKGDDEIPEGEEFLEFFQYEDLPF